MGSSELVCRGCGVAGPGTKEQKVSTTSWPPCLLQFFVFHFNRSFKAHVRRFFILTRGSTLKVDPGQLFLTRVNFFRILQSWPGSTLKVDPGPTFKNVFTGLDSAIKTHLWLKFWIFLSALYFWRKKSWPRVNFKVGPGSTFGSTISHVQVPQWHPFVHLLVQLI